MKTPFKIHFLLLCLGLFALHATAQPVQLITTDEQRTAYDGNSYLVVKSITLKPGFTASASNGPWYAKMHPNAVPPVAPSSDQNFVRSETILTGGVTNEAQVKALPIAGKATSFAYSDGVGRPTQTTAVSASPQLNDVVQPMYYDAIGRPSRSYLPYVPSGNAGAFRGSALAEQAAFYSNPNDKVADDSRPYSEVTYDDSPLGRITQSRAPGAAWATKPVNYSFKINDAGVVKRWTIASNLPVSTSTYEAGTLAIEESTNEEGHTSRTYTDFVGRTVLTETQTTQGRWAQTYYVYDVAGNVRFVIPPALAATSDPLQSQVDNWCFQNEYDQYQRKTGAKAPGVGWVYTIYDQWDRPVLTQDANQRAKNPAEWDFVKYDDLNRPVMTGILKTNASRSVLTSTLAGFNVRYESRAATAVGYTLNQSYPNTITEADLLTISYFDDYDFLLVPGWDFQNKSFAFVAEPGYTGAKFLNANGKILDLPTGSKVRILNSTTWLNSVTYYDNRYRPIQTISENHFEQLDRLTSEYDFTGQVLKTKQVHTSSANTFTVQERFDYDVNGRVLRSWHQVNNQPEILLAAFEYNELGQLVDKKIHSTNQGATWLQSVDLRYHIRGWNTRMNTGITDGGDPADYFAMEFGYDNSLSGNTPRYDGMISGVRWKHDLSNKNRVYNYTYDKGSLASAQYKVDNAVNTQANVLNESITYDLNGNIQTLNRNGGAERKTADPIDQLVYTYEAGGGNKLQKVNDVSTSVNKAQGFNDGANAATEYVYDPNGNLINDVNKLVSITYNFLNLPERINLNGGNYILFTYDATGTRLRQAYYNSANQELSRLDYLGDWIYENGNAEVLFHAQGRLVAASNENLISDLATREANSTAGFTANTSSQVTISSAQFGSPLQTYVQAACTVNGGTPGVYPIGGTISVNPGQQYVFRVLGYQVFGINAQLYVSTASGTNISWPGAALPIGAANENWVGVTFTVPAGVTQIKVGVLWNGGGQSNLMRINRVALYRADWEYQYFLNDHLGSPRVVLQTEPTTTTYKATMEPANFNYETERFLNLKSNSEANFAAANATPGGTFAYYMYSGEPAGPGRSFKVLPGDVIDASVMAFYASGGSYPKRPVAEMFTAVAAALGGGTPLTEGVTASYTNSGASLPGFTLSQDQGSTRPSAFINYILFDETYTPIEAKSAPVGATAGVLHPVVLPTINVTQTGYVYVYLSYDNTAGNPVYFDEFAITYREGPAVQVNSYYPYGMTAMNWSRSGEYESKYQYQSKEYDSRTALHDFHARQYDAQLGRWFADDPKGFLTPNIGNYAAMMNNPVMMVDPDGELPILIPIAIGALAGGYSGYKIGKEKGATGWNMFGYIAGGAAIGGISGYFGGAITAAGGAFANTGAIIVSSTLNSIGMYGLSGGQTPVVTSFGGFSYDWTNNDLGHLGKKGNSKSQNVGYSFGALANLQDAFAGFQGGNAEVRSYHTGKNDDIAHSRIENDMGNIDISVANRDPIPASGTLDWAKKAAVLNNKWGAEHYVIPSTDQHISTKLFNVNEKILTKLTMRLRGGKDIFLPKTNWGLFNGCTQHSAYALWAVGIPTLPINFVPVMLNVQLGLRQAGIYASPFLTSYGR